MIRKAEEKDFENILSLEMNSNHPFYEIHTERRKGIPVWLKRRFNESNNEFYVYEKEGKIIGYVALKKEFPAPNSGEIICLNVSVEEQRKGIGKELMGFAEKRIEELGFTRSFLYTGKENPRAQNFYEKLGYEKINEFPDYYGTGDVAFLYGKWLKK
jgi:ribosomal protein S18 acetylase RimI-like enzyme